MKGMIAFQSQFKTQELDAAALPVEIRKPSSALVSRTVSSRPVQVDPGTYHVFATLPTGVEIVDTVTVLAGQSVTVQLQPAPADESPHESHEWQHMVVRRFPDGTVRHDDPAPASAYLRAWRGNVLTEGCEVVSGTLHLRDYDASSRSLAEFQTQGAAQPGFVQLIWGNSMSAAVAVPASPDGQAFVSIRRQGAEMDLAARIDHPSADLLIGYLAHNRLQLAGGAGDALVAEEVLGRKMQHPVAGAVAGYSLLQMNALARLHDWTANLMNWFAWLPDGAAIRGEHLARLGNHLEAAKAFLLLGKRGLPLFSLGFSFTLDRLHLYERARPARFDKRTAQDIARLLDKLELVAEHVDFEKLVMTIQDIDPDQVLKEKPRNRPAKQLAVDLAPYVLPRTARFRKRRHRRRTPK